jgi:hypothetical protein
VQLAGHHQERFAVHDQLARAVARFQVRPGIVGGLRRAWGRHLRGGQGKEDCEEMCFH